MTTMLLRRLVQAVIVLFIVTVIVFLIMHLIPGDPAQIMLGSTATQEQIDALRHQMGLDKPLVVQYFLWLGNVLHGNLGTSIFYNQPVTQLLAVRLPITLQLGLYSLVVSLILGIPAGIIAAVKRGTFIDSIVIFLSNAGVAIPVFWLAILGVYVFSLKLGWLPVQGWVSPFENFGEGVRYLVMPVLVLATLPLSSFARQTRSSMLEVIRQDYIRTARAKGLKENVVILRHALRNALIPVITLLGISLAGIIGGAVLVEQVFNIPGMGRLLVQAILGKDYILVQGSVLIIGAIVVLINLATDIAYTYVDPRIKG
ncbi:MAG: ABC transporter permease [Alicyclobacillaceae bacterium]|nr:ABC transporter permease [Alicyclobacillaceae bacterium]